jgi:hypothetical protein
MEEFSAGSHRFKFLMTLKSMKILLGVIIIIIVLRCWKLSQRMHYLRDNKQLVAVIIFWKSTHKKINAIVVIMKKGSHPFFHIALNPPTVA